MTDRAALQEKEADCQSVADFAALVSEALQDPSDTEYAAELAQKAEGLCVEVEDTVAYVGILHQLGRDAGELRELLEAAEMDCQFTKQFVALAQGFRDFCADDAKVQELMEQAEEFCMTDEEQIDLGDGIQLLLGDAERAAACYEKGLAGVQDKEALLQLAEKFAGPLNNPDLARQVYERAEAKMSSGNELRKLAQSILEHLKDQEAVGALYQRAAESITAPNDLINLAGDSLKIGLNELAESMYQKVLEGATDSAQAMKLLEPLQQMEGTEALLSNVLDRASTLTSASPQLLEIAQQAHAIGDAERMRKILTTAEENVASLGELTDVAAAVEQLAGDDAQWRERLAAKIEKRQANQARYLEFQDQEKVSETPLQLIQLADRVMQELEDGFYARKLLDAAHALLRGEAPDTNLTCLLARTADRHLDDPQWTQEIMQNAVETATDFSTLRRLAQAACEELNDVEAGRNWARGWYENWLQNPAAERDVYACLKLARAVLDDLQDHALALKILSEAPVEDAEPMALAQMGLLARDADSMDQAQQHFQSAVQAATTPDQTIALMQLLRRADIDEESLRTLYRDAAPQSPDERLRWTEGILEVFEDAQWCAQAYEELTPTVTEDLLLMRLTMSQESRLGRALVR